MGRLTKIGLSICLSEQGFLCRNSIFGEGFSESVVVAVAVSQSRRRIIYEITLTLKKRHKLAEYVRGSH